MMSPGDPEEKESIEADTLKILAEFSKANHLPHDDPRTLNIYLDAIAKRQFVDSLKLKKTDFRKFDVATLERIFKAVVNGQLLDLDMTRTLLYYKSSSSTSKLAPPLALDRIKAIFNQIKISQLISLDLSWNNLKEAPNACLEHMFNCIAASNITALGLNKNNFGELTLEQIDLIFKPLIKSKLKYLNLDDNLLFQLDDEKLQRVFKYISESNVTELNLGRNLGEMNSDQITIVSRALKKSQINKLSLENSDLSTLSNKDLTTLLTAITDNPKITSLDLSGIDFDKLRPDAIGIIFNIIATSNIRSLSLKECNLSNVPSEVLLKALNHLRTSRLTSLDLSYNSLGNLGDAFAKEIAEFIAGSNVTALGYAHNSLGLLDANMLRSFIDLLTTNLTSLDLGHNDIGKFDNERVLALSEPIAKSRLTTLNLEGNDLANLHQEDSDPNPINTLFEQLKASSISDLNLAGNHLGSLRNSNKLDEILEYIKQSQVLVLNLSENYLHQLSPERKASFLQTLQDSTLVSLTHGVTKFDDLEMHRTLEGFCKTIAGRKQWAEVAVTKAFIHANKESELKESIFSLLDSINQFANLHVEADLDPGHHKLQAFTKTKLFSTLIVEPTKEVQPIQKPDPASNKGAQSPKGSASSQ